VSQFKTRSLSRITFTLFSAVYILYKMMMNSVRREKKNQQAKFKKKKKRKRRGESFFFVLRRTGGMRFRRIIRKINMEENGNQMHSCTLQLDSLFSF
jgi:hypothetical protein